MMEALNRLSADLSLLSASRKLGSLMLGCVHISRMATFSTMSRSPRIRVVSLSNTSSDVLRGESVASVSVRKEMLQSVGEETGGKQMEFICIHNEKLLSMCGLLTVVWNW